MNIDNLVFLKEEVLVTELKPQEEKDNPFTNTSLPQDKNDYILYKVVKIGKKQLDVKEGDKVLIIGSLPQSIKIKNQGAIPDIFKIPNADQIFAIVC